MAYGHSIPSTKSATYGLIAMSFVGGVGILAMVIIPGIMCWILHQKRGIELKRFRGIFSQIFFTTINYFFIVFLDL